MGTNTTGRTQVFSVVGAGLPNAGASSIEDADLKFEREFKTQTVTSSDLTLTTPTNPIDTNQFKTIELTVDASITITAAMFTNKFNNAGHVLVVQQDATGGFTVLLDGADFEFSLDLPSVTFQTGANKIDMLGLQWSTSLNKFLVTAFLGGFN